MTALYEITFQIQDLESRILEIMTDEELDEAEREGKLEHLFETFLEKNEDFTDKVNSVIKYIRSQESLTDQRRAEAQRLNKLAQSSERVAENCRKYLALQMQRLGLTKIEGVQHRTFLRRKPPQLEIVIPPEEIPSRFVNVEYKPRLGEIKGAIKSGMEIGWAKLVESDEYSITIK